MEKTRFGKTGLMVSKLAFGGIPIMRVSKTEAVSIIREAIKLGINFIDTANGYADSEEKIGEAIKGVRREDIIIATKSDKLNKTQREANLNKLKNENPDCIIIPFSSLSGEGVNDVRKNIAEHVK